jgi:glycine betaine/proline transport system substrate-binding protein
MLAYMQENDASAEDAAVHFLKTSEDWTKWVPADVAERVKASLNAM